MPGGGPLGVIGPQFDIGGPPMGEGPGGPTLPGGMETGGSPAILEGGSGGPQGPGPGVDEPELPAGLPTYPGPGGPEGGPQGTS